jgi:sensor histidine kinase YesM
LCGLIYSIFSANDLLTSPHISWKDSILFLFLPLSSSLPLSPLSPSFSLFLPLYKISYANFIVFFCSLIYSIFRANDLLTSPHISWKDSIQLLQHLNQHSLLDSSKYSKKREKRERERERRERERERREKREEREERERRERENRESVCVEGGKEERQHTTAPAPQSALPPGFK